MIDVDLNEIFFVVLSKNIEFVKKVGISIILSLVNKFFIFVRVVLVLEWINWMRCISIEYKFLCELFML